MACCKRSPTRTTAVTDRQQHRKPSERYTRTAADDAPTENLPPAEGVAEDANTEIVSASPLTNQPDSVRAEVPDEANSLSMKKISARLKRLARPLANAHRFVAG